jgi:EmrB/QacA subfamily drug resistance transporter
MPSGQDSPRVTRLQEWRYFRWLALIVVTGGMMLSVLNVTVANIALPEIADEFGASASATGWVVTGFLVTQATLLAVAGRAGDVFGRRRVFVAGVLILSIASVAAALAPSLPVLIVARIVQGIGGSAMAPTAFSFAGELFGPRERGQALGIMGGVLGLAPVISLNLAGALVEAGGWRTVFWFSPVVGAVVLVGALAVLPEMKPERKNQRFDLPGAGLAAAALFSLLFGLSQGDDWGWLSAPVLGGLVAGIGFSLLFVWREARAEEAMIDLALFRLRSVASSSLAAMASSGALFGILLVLPFVFTAGLGFGPIELGLAITPIALSFVIVAPIAGRLMRRTGAGRMAFAGFLLSALGVCAMALVAPEQDYLVLLPGLAAFGVGLAMSSSPITTTAISEVPRERLGVASALPNISRYVGGALGSAVLIALVQAEAGELGVEGASGAAVAQGFRLALLAAGCLLLIAAAIATRMPDFRAPRRAYDKLPAAAPGASGP